MTLEAFSFKVGNLRIESNFLHSEQRKIFYKAKTGFVTLCDKYERICLLASKMLGH